MKELQQVEDLCVKIKICSGILYQFISGFGNLYSKYHLLFFLVLHVEQIDWGHFFLIA